MLHLPCLSYVPAQSHLHSPLWGGCGCMVLPKDSHKMHARDRCAGKSIRAWQVKTTAEKKDHGSAMGSDTAFSPEPHCNQEILSQGRAYPVPRAHLKFNGGPSWKVESPSCLMPKTLYQPPVNSCRSTSSDRAWLSFSQSCILWQ